MESATGRPARLSYPPVAFQILLVLLALTAALFDFRQKRVPNWLTFSGVLLGLAVNSFLFELPGLWLALQGLGLALLIYLPIYLLRGMGAGDVKLMAAIGAILGPANWLGVLVLTSLFGALFGLIVIARQARMSRTLFNVGLILASLRQRQAPYHANPELDVRDNRAVSLPHAVAIACGTLGFLLAANWWATR